MTIRAFKFLLIAGLAIASIDFTSSLSPSWAAPDTHPDVVAEASPAASSTPPAAGASAAGEQGALPMIVAARLSMAPGRARLIVDLSGPTVFAIVSLDHPDRIAVDIKASGLALKQPDSPAGHGLVSDYEIDMAAPDRARVTLDLVETARVQQAYVLKAFGDQPARLVVDLIPTSPKQFAANVAADLAAARAGTAADAPKAATASLAAAAEPTGGKPLIIIDPGHGGIDGGARAGDGMTEKAIVLDFALKLQKLLAQSGRFDVALTRTDDSYLTLSERVELARKNRADLFVSIHADTFADPDIRGFTVYTRDRNATGELDKILADKENRADIVAPYTRSDTPPQVVDLLVDLMERQTRRRSYLAAQDIVQAASSSLELRKIPVRRADFFVLEAPEVPSVLVELGFLSNAHDIRDLEDERWQEKAAESLARGVAAFFDDLSAPKMVTAQN